jgi:hypothetical protein
MGREIRMVPPNWNHPRGERGDHQPMYDKRFEDAAAKWKDDFRKWEAGEREEWIGDSADGQEYWEYNGDPPDRAYYRPWKDGEGTWFQVWETVSEGTPVSPPFATKQELIEYLVEHGDFWDQQRRREGLGGLIDCQPWSRASAEGFVNGPGWAPSFIADSRGVRKGVEALGEMKAKE